MNRVVQRRARLAVTAVIVALWCATASTGVAAAHAFPPGANPFAPSPIRSSIDSIEPASAKDTITVETYGSIAYQWLQAKLGHEVIILGYQDEPYLRLAADGKTYDNLRSPTYYINTDPNGSGTIPTNADPTAPPDWKLDTPYGGTETWHDHRIHWMQAEPPTTTAGSDRIEDWQLKLTVDGAPVTVKGTLHRDPAIPWSAYQIAITAQRPAPAGGKSSTAPLIVPAVAVMLAAAGGIYLVRHRPTRSTTRRPARRR